MALKVKAVEKNIKFEKNSEGVWRYVMQPDLYIALSQAKVIREAALRSGGGQLKVTLWHCPDWEPCVSDSVRRA